MPLDADTIDTHSYPCPYINDSVTLILTVKSTSLFVLRLHTVQYVIFFIGSIVHNWCLAPFSISSKLNLFSADFYYFLVCLIFHISYFILFLRTIIERAKCLNKTIQFITFRVAMHQLENRIQSK